MIHKKRGRSINSRKLPHPNLWVVLSVVVLVVCLSVLTAVGPFSPLTGNTVQNIGRLNKGDPFHVSVRDVPGVEKVVTNAAETMQNAVFTIEVDDSIPFNYPYVTKFIVKSENKFGPLQFTFKVKEQDLLAKGISRGDLRLYHGLQEYSLQLLKVDHGYLYYVVTVPSMGNFVLGRVESEKIVEKPAEVVEEPAPATGQPAVTVDEVSEEEQQPLVGRAAEEPAPEMEKKGFFARIAEFFRNLFS